jgi:hypothetical protein
MPEAATVDLLTGSGIDEYLTRMPAISSYRVLPQHALSFA